LSCLSPSFLRLMNLICHPYPHQSTLVFTSLLST
jgi:hypothetical protein